MGFVMTNLKKRETEILSQKMLKKKKNLPFSNIIQNIAPIILNSVDKNLIQKIYLFGSYAYGNPHENSDIDICVVLDNVENQLEINIDISSALFDKNILNYDLLVYKENQFYSSDNYKSIENTIINKGKILYERKKDNGIYP